MSGSALANYGPCKLCTNVTNDIHDGGVHIRIWEYPC